MYSNLVKYVPNRKPPMGAVLNPYLPINRGLVFYLIMWEGSGNIVSDFIGNNNTCIRNGTGNIWTPGKFASAQQFNGTDDFIEVPHSSSLVTSNITLIIWVKIPESPDYNALIDKSDSGGDGYNVFISNSDTFTFRINSQSWDSNIQVDADVWHQLVGTYDGVTRRIYSDAIEKNNAALAGSVINTTSVLRISKRSFDADAWFINGLVDLPMIYNRALSASEIAELYRDSFKMSRIYWNWGVFGTISVVTDVYSGRGIGRGVGRGLVR